MWEHRIAEDRRCLCGEEDVPDHWTQGLAYGTLSERGGSKPDWQDSQKALLHRHRPAPILILEGCECFAQGDLAEPEDFFCDEEWFGLREEE